MMAAVALDPELVAADPGAAARGCGRDARQAGLLTRWLWDGVAIAPPLTIEDGHIEEIVGALATALDACQARADAERRRVRLVSG